MADNDVKVKANIETAINAFSEDDFSNQAVTLFTTLGYNTQRRSHLGEKTFRFFKDEFFEDSYSQYNEEKAIVAEWKSIDFLFQLTKDELNFDDNQIQKKVITKLADGTDEQTIIESYVFLAIELIKPEYSRTVLSQITREINKIFRMPAMIVFKYGGRLTISTINRRLNKKDPEKDVLKKVTLIKDISIDKPHRAHIDILLDLSYEKLLQKHKFTNFVELHNAWQKTLHISELNKKFFHELSNWYFWALGEVEFPEDADKNKDVRNATSVIRMITRLIFIWFIKERGLISEDIFNHTKIINLLNFIDKHDSTYYKAILQNLFFATLNTEMNKDKPGSRKFRGKSKVDNRDQHYMIHNVFRYEDYFRTPQDTLNIYFDGIPFLNGGLFECLDKTMLQDGKDKVIRIDGFSDHPKNTLKVPDYLFFSMEKSIDLNEVYGTRNKTYRVRGLIDILHSYKFTIEENTPIEEDIALDPELLGRVFENLLASYNPETKTTARKQTGSFYTPREIVNYMVDESLKAFFQQKLETETNMNPDDIKVGLEFLIGYHENEHLFDEEQTDVLIKAIDNIKILDPACGSGAFPMGMLHKLVYLLGKLDPYDEPGKSKWRELQKQKAIIETEEAYNIGDKEERKTRLLEINEVFENNSTDYGRKFYLIENSIYGVDIQPIAIQITKLRFFISLIVDQNIDKKEKNLGIIPLPNLETNFIAANTLIDIEKPKAQLHLFDNKKIETLEEELKKVRHRLFNAKTHKTKRELRERDKTIRDEIGVLLISDGYGNETARRLAAWDPYDQNAVSPFFNAEWMFGVRGGFDVVIGNPPYISHEKIKNKDIIKDRYYSYNPFADIYCYFLEIAIQLQNKNGYLSFITSNSYLRAEYGVQIRKYIKDNNYILHLINIENAQVFDNAIVEVAIIISSKTRFIDKSDCSVVNTQFQLETINFKDFIYNNSYLYSQKEFSTKYWNLVKSNVLILQRKIEGRGKTLERLGIKIRLGLATGSNDAFIINEHKRSELITKNSINNNIIKPILRGKDILRYNYILPGYYILLTKNGIDVKKEFPDIYKHLESFGDTFKSRGAQGNHWSNLRACSFYDDFKREKIIWIELADTGRFALCSDEVYLLNSAYFLLPSYDYPAKYLLGILNSNIIKFYLNLIAQTSGMGTNRWINNFVKEFPIPNALMNDRKLIISLVDQILTLKKNDPKSDTTVLEHEIDRLVYKLYELTPEEVAIVEGKG
ncbi:MAG: Eco57I restriction-modification methylase domain-containing protein [Nitrospirota bacterium]